MLFLILGTPQSLQSKTASWIHVQKAVSYAQFGEIPSRGCIPELSIIFGHGIPAGSVGGSGALQILRLIRRQLLIVFCHRVPAGRRVCQVVDINGLNDDLFNELIYKGLQDSHAIYGWDIQALQSASNSDVDRNFAEFQRGDCDLIVGTGIFSDALRVAALADPDQKFLMPDIVFNEPMENVWTQLYAIDQAAFLAGYAAASVSKTGKVGVFGGIDFPPVTDFMDGFALGVQSHNQKNGTNIEVLGWDVEKREGLFVGGFCCAADGRAITGQLLDGGADVILPVAGPDVGAGALFAVKSHGDAYIIGVDNDWTVSEPTYADIILTSIMKNNDVSVVQVVKAIEDGTFTGGIHVGTLETGDVGIAPFYELDALISEQVKADLEQIKNQIIDGSIETRP